MNSQVGRISAAVAAHQAASRRPDRVPARASERRWRFAERHWRRMLILGLLAVVLLPVAGVGLALASYARDVQAAAPFYASPGVPRDYGQRVQLVASSHVRILPLVEWYTSRPDLGTAPGLSYLVQTDDTTVLLDLGLKGPDGQSLALHNMALLGMDPASIDLVANSHPHADHLNGATDRAVLSETNDPLAGKPVYSTVPLQVTGGMSTIVDAPRALTATVGSTGALPVGLFGSGYTLEQSLVIELQDKGLVLVVGCGHPGVQALVNRAEQVYQRPVYAVIGGLHLMPHDGRVMLGPIATQKLLASSTPPWRMTGEADVDQAITFLQDTGISVVGLSGHDSDDWTLQRFAQAFGADYRPVRVGEPIQLS